MSGNAWRQYMDDGSHIVVMRLGQAGFKRMEPEVLKGQCHEIFCFSFFS
jgi:hypothetical protein